MLKTLHILAFAILLLSVAQVAGQSSDDHDVGLTIPQIALLDIEPNIANITLSLTPPSEAGRPLTVGAAGTNNSKWLNYSSAIAPAAPARTVTAQVTSGAVPNGLNLLLQASSYSGGGAGTTGSPVGQVTLNNTAKTIISGIGGSYTGNGANNGHRLTYTLAISDYAQLNYSQSTNLQITFTISD